MVIFGYPKAKLHDLEDEVKRIKVDLELLSDKYKTLKGYVYAKKVHLEEENGSQPECNPLLPPYTGGIHLGNL